MKRVRQAAKTRQVGPRKLGAVVTQLLSRRGYGQLEASDQVMDAWQNVSGNLGKQSCPGNIRRGVLDVTVKNSAVLQELSFRKQQLLRELKQHIPDAKIRDIHFRVGVIDG
jgi:predicted nucleic acid-binding Zn ribbon protein